jgi:hypothetical protein
MGLSGLNSHRMRYRFIDNSICNYCNHRNENIQHFLLFCPAFAAQRQVMMEGLREWAPLTVQPLLNFEQQKKLILPMEKLLLYGTGDPKLDENLFTIVQTFISKTNRFS